MPEMLKNMILKGHRITRQEAEDLLSKPLNAVCQSANEIREYFCLNSFDICTVINAKSNIFANDENCLVNYCSNDTCKEKFLLWDILEMVKKARYHFDMGILRLAIMTAGQILSQDDIAILCQSYRSIRKSCPINLCASHGHLPQKSFRKLKEAGVARYHCALESSRKFFPEIFKDCLYEDKIKTIKNAQKTGFEVCSGGILGVGESFSDRLDMAFELRGLGIKSVILNWLHTTSGKQNIDSNELKLTIAVYRFILPDAAIRLGTERYMLPDCGKSMICSGANAAIIKGMLETENIDVKSDLDTFLELGFRIKEI